jgi:hypothetical protein
MNEAISWWLPHVLPLWMAGWALWCVLSVGEVAVEKVAARVLANG